MEWGKKGIWMQGGLARSLAAPLFGVFLAEIAGGHSLHQIPEGEPRPPCSDLPQKFIQISKSIL